MWHLVCSLIIGVALVSGVPPATAADAPVEPPRTGAQLVGVMCSEMWATRDEYRVRELEAVMREVAVAAIVMGQHAVAAAAGLNRDYDAINARADVLQAEREFLLSSSPGRVRRGGLTSLLEQREEALKLKYQEGIGLEQRISRLQRQVLEARDITARGFQPDVPRLRDPRLRDDIPLSQQALQLLQRTVGDDARQAIQSVGRRVTLDTGGVDASGRTGRDIQAELNGVQSSNVPAFAATLGALLGRVPAPPIAAILAAIESESAKTRSQLASERAADDAARAARVAEIDRLLREIDEQRRPILNSSDDVLRDARRSRGVAVIWNLALARVQDCARDQLAWLRSQGVATGAPTPPVEPPGEPGVAGAGSWAGTITGSWTSSCTHNNKPLGTPAGRFSLEVDARGGITGAFVEAATSAIGGSVNAKGKLFGTGSYVMRGTRLQLSLYGDVLRKPAGGIAGRGRFESTDGAGVVCTGQWEG